MVFKFFAFFVKKLVLVGFALKLFYDVDGKSGWLIDLFVFIQSAIIKKKTLSKNIFLERVELI